MEVENNDEKWLAARWLVPLGLAVGALLLLLFPLAKPVWTDELISIGRGRLPLELILKGRMGAADAMPLHSLMLSLIGKPLGDTLAIHRLVSALPAAVALWYVYLLGRRLGERTGVLALWLAALSPCAVLFLRMSRYHGVTTLLVVMSCYYLLQLFDKSQKKALVKYLFATALMMLSYPLTMFVAAGQFLILALRFKKTERPLWVLGALALAGAAFLCYFVPALQWASRTLVHDQVEDPSMGLGLSGLIRRLGLSVYALCLGETILPWNVALFVPGIFLALGGFAVGMWGVRRRPEVLLPFACAFVVVLAGAATSTQMGGSSQTVGSMGKRTSFLIPLFCVTVAAGLSSLKKWRWLPLPLLSVWALGTYNYFAGREFLNPNYTVNWNEAVATIKTRQLDASTGLYASAEDALIYYLKENKIALPVMGKARGLDELKEALAQRKLRHIWILGRDRGDRMAVADFDAARELLRASGAQRIDEAGVYPRTESEKTWWGKALKRPLWDHYLLLELWEVK
jgi:hypothetical protein